MKTALINKIDYLVSIGINISFKRNLNYFEIELSKNDSIESVSLPFDHLNEEKIVNYISLMEDKING